MAEESGGASWWSSWDKVFDNVKEKSASVYELVAKDLQEFVSTIQSDATEVIAETAHVVKEKLEVDESDQDSGTASMVKQGVSTWLGNVSTSLKEGMGKVSAASIQSPNQPQSSTSIFDRAKARVEHMQTDPATYCNEPNGPIDLYSDWCTTFNLENHKGEISDLLVNNSKVRALYTNLVPVAVTHSLFWHRYFYKLHQFEEEDKRKAGIMARASQLEQEDLGWGDDDDELWGSEDTLSVGLPQQPSLVKSAHEQTMIRDDLEFDTDKQKEPSNIDTVDIKSQTCLEKNNDERKRDEETVVMLDDTEGKNEPEPSTAIEKFANEKPCQLIKSVDDSCAITKDVDNNEVIEAKMTETLESLKLKSYDVPVDKEEITQEGEIQRAGEQPENAAEKIKSVLSLSEENSQSDDSGSFVKVPGNSLEQQISKSDFSDDGSWAKLSDEELPKEEAFNKEQSSKEFQRDDITSPDSSSMSSPVHIPDVPDKEKEEEDEDAEGTADDLWDEDFDLDEDISDNEVQRIVEAMKNKDPSQIVEDDDWEDWE